MASLFDGEKSEIWNAILQMADEKKTLFFPSCSYRTAARIPLQPGSASAHLFHRAYHWSVVRIGWILEFIPMVQERQLYADFSFAN